MSVFFRYAFRTFAGLCTALTLPLSASAQGDPPSTSLALTLSTFGGWESDITGMAANPEAAPSAPYAGSNAALNYQTRSEKIAFSTRGSIDYRHYRTDSPVSAVSYAGNSALAADLTSRLSISANIYSLYSPRFVFSLLPVASEAATFTTPTPLDYGLSTQSVRQISAGTTATLRVTRRSSLNVALSGSRQQLLDDNLDLTTKSYGGGYSYSVSQYTRLRIGYRQQESDYPSYSTLPPKRYSQRSFDGGIDYSKPLSVSRRTTVSFSTGSSAIDDGIETFVNFTATASLRHQMGRTWEANIGYQRGMSVVAGFAEPFFADSVHGNVRGGLSRNVRLEIAGGYANGMVGLGSRGEDYIGYRASSGLEWVVHRERIAVYADYYFYSYEFGGATTALASIPRQVNHHGVRAGLRFRFPLLRERTPRVTR
jgi:hypothetical protein